MKKTILALALVAFTYGAVSAAPVQPKAAKTTAVAKTDTVKKKAVKTTKVKKAVKK